jgi:hypothetical protein
MPAIETPPAPPVVPPVAPVTPPVVPSPSLITTPPAPANPPGVPPVPAPNTDPFYKDWQGADGKINKTAYDRLPDDLKPHAELLKSYDTTEALLRALVHNKQMAGKKGLERPIDSAAPEVKAEFEKTLHALNAAPEKPEGYGIKKPDAIPAEMWSEPALKEFVELAHKHHANPEFVKAAIELQTKMAMGQTQTSLAAQQQQMADYKAGQMAELKKAWPDETAFQKNAAAAQRMAITLGFKPEDAIFGRADMVLALAKMHDLISPDKLVSGDMHSDLGSGFRAQALDIQNNEANPLYKAYRGIGVDAQTHQRAVDKVQELNEKYAAQEAKKKGG